MILKVIPHFILKKAQLITLQELLLKIYWRFQKKLFWAINVVFQSNPPTFLKRTCFNPSGTLTIFGLFVWKSFNLGIDFAGRWVTLKSPLTSLIDGHILQSGFLIQQFFNNFPSFRRACIQTLSYAERMRWVTPLVLIFVLSPALIGELMSV